uniref:Uncharacterized protein n=1 Tax=Cucumis melo TaxID=3656 RepID=A0A9I9EHL7_CUCME
MVSRHLVEENTRNGSGSQMNGTTSWSDSIVKKTVRYGKMKKTYYTFLIGKFIPQVVKRWVERHVELNTISKGDFLEEIDVDDVVVALVNLPKRVS